MNRTLLALPVLALAAGAAQAEQITFVSQGGAYQEAQTKAILEPAAELLGITINQDSAPDAWPVIRTQTATGKPIWDVIDTPTKDCIRGGEQGMIEALDFSKIPNAADLPDAYKSPYSVAYEFYSSVLAYNSDTYGENGPQSWADFWDVEKFPGHIACSSLSKSEIVVPVIRNNEVVAVLDVDSDQ
ncbi:MAG: extracellular solute-binding protein, partial [Gemmobacter sp.]